MSIIYACTSACYSWEVLPENWNAVFVPDNDANKCYKFNKKYLHKLSTVFGWKLNRKVAAMSKFGSGEENLKFI
jgi:hypothetical protein